MIFKAHFRLVCNTAAPQKNPKTCYLARYSCLNFYWLHCLNLEKHIQFQKLSQFFKNKKTYFHVVCITMHRVIILRGYQKFLRPTAKILWRTSSFFIIKNVTNSKFKCIHSLITIDRPILILFNQNCLVHFVFFLM